MSLSGANVGEALLRLEEEIDKQGKAYAKLYIENYRLGKENEELRKFTRTIWDLLTMNEPQVVWQSLVEDAKKLGMM